MDCHCSSAAVEVPESFDLVVVVAADYIVDSFFTFKVFFFYLKSKSVKYFHIKKNQCQTKTFMSIKKRCLSDVETIVTSLKFGFNEYCILNY